MVLANRHTLLPLPVRFCLRPWLLVKVLQPLKGLVLPVKFCQPLKGLVPVVNRLMEQPLPVRFCLRLRDLPLAVNRHLVLQPRLCHLGKAAFMQRLNQVAKQAFCMAFSIAIEPLPGCFL
jgi:hypothetical protein